MEFLLPLTIELAKLRKKARSAFFRTCIVLLLGTRHPLFHDVDIMEACAINLFLADQIRESLTFGPSHAIDITREVGVLYETLLF